MTRRPEPTPPSTRTLDLVERARAGDRPAYDTLFGLAADRVLLYIRARLGKRLRAKVDSLDVLQEAYLAAHEGFDGFQYRGDGAFARWLCRLAENRIRGLADHFGAQKRTPPGGHEQVTAVLDRVRTSGSGPATRADRREQRERLEAELAGLDEPDREVLLYRFFQGLTIDEVAAATGRSATAVRRALAKAVLRLGDALAAPAAPADGEPGV